MRLTVVGSADAFNSSGRCHSCYLLEAPGAKPIMIDFGATALSALRKTGHEPNELGGVVVTHLHGDHIGGFPFLLIDAMFNSFRTDALSVLGPVRSEMRILETFVAAYGDLAERERPFDTHIEEMPPGESRDFLGWKVRGFEAQHMDPPDRPLCLAIEAPSGKRIAFSGDTAMCDGLFEASQGVDLLVAECTGMRPPMGEHCTWQEWEANFDRLGTSRLLLTHLNTEVREAAPALAASVDALDLSFAEDGLVVDV